jgi:hypothetical protein
MSAVEVETLACPHGDQGYTDGDRARDRREGSRGLPMNLPSCPMCGAKLRRLWDRDELGNVARCTNTERCGAFYRGPWPAERGWELPKGGEAACPSATTTS